MQHIWAYGDDPAKLPLRARPLYIVESPRRADVKL